MVIRQDGEVRLLPILEINPRFTMGRAALEIHRSTGLRGGWFFITDAEITQAGMKSREAFIAAVRSADALTFTTDPLAVTRTLTVMAGAKNSPDAQAAWAALGLEWPD